MKYRRRVHAPQEQLTQEVESLGSKNIPWDVSEIDPWDAAAQGEYIDRYLAPVTRTISEEGTFFLAFDAMQRVARELLARGVNPFNGDLGDILRQIGDNACDISYDWAMQADHGTKFDM